MRRLAVNPVPCTGCQNCMAACALMRAGAGGGERRLAAPAIRIALDPFGGRHRILVCRQCDPAPCAAACPAGALERGADGLLRLAAERCIGCLACRDACPFEAVFEDEAGGGPPVRCDLCGGEGGGDGLAEMVASGEPTLSEAGPRCAEACVFGALRWLAAGDPEGSSP